MAFLMVQPLMEVIKPVEDCCSTGCCKKNDKRKDGNTGKDCNPLMACEFCNLFVVCENISVVALLIDTKVKISIMDDNRIIKSLTECWHPPNFAS